MTDLSRTLLDSQAAPSSSLHEATAIPRRSIGWRALDTAAAASWRLIIVVAALWIALKVVDRVWVVVLPVLVALLLVIAVWPVKAWCERRGMRPLLATWLAFLVPLMVIGGLGASTYLGTKAQFADLDETVTEGLDDARDWATGSPLNLSDDQVENISDTLSAEAKRFVEGPRARDYARTVVDVAAGMVLSMVVFFFLLHDGRRIRDWGISRFPVRRRDEVRRLADAAWRAVRGYLRGTLLIGVVEAVLVLVLLLVIGVPMAIPLALLTGFAAFFPLVGAVVAGGLSVIATFVTVGPTEAVIVAVAVLVLQQVDGDVLQPMLMSNAVRLHPLVILLALTAGAVVGGIAGAFLAVPVTAVVVAVSREWSHSRTAEILTQPASQSD